MNIEICFYNNYDQNALSLWKRFEMMKSLMHMFWIQCDNFIILSVGIEQSNFDVFKHRIAINQPYHQP